MTDGFFPTLVESHQNAGVDGRLGTPTWTSRPKSEVPGFGTVSERLQEFNQIRLLCGSEIQNELARQRPVPFNSTSLAVTAW